MSFPRRRRRNSLRASWHDYRDPGAYMITICVEGRHPVLSRIRRGKSLLTPLGRLVQQTWESLPATLRYVELDQFVVMPDHLHGIVWVVDPFSGAAPSSSRGPAARSLGAFVAQFKSRVTKAAVAAGLSQPGARLWQRGYHERIIASVEGLRRARRYIRLNPERAADS